MLRQVEKIEINGENKDFYYYLDENGNVSEFYEWATEYGENDFAFVKSNTDNLIHLRDKMGNLSNAGFLSLVKDFQYGLACVRLPDKKRSVECDKPYDINGKPFDRTNFTENKNGELFEEQYAFIDTLGRISSIFSGVSYAKRIYSGSTSTDMSGETEYNDSNFDAKVLLRKIDWIRLESGAGEERISRYSWIPLKECFEFNEKEFKFMCNEFSKNLIDLEKQTDYEASI